MEEINLADLRNKCLISLYSCTENICKYVNTENDRKEEFNKVKHCVKEYCKMEQMEQSGIKAIQSLEKESDYIDRKSLENQYQSKMAQYSKKCPKFDKHPYMKEFEKHMNVESQEDPELGSDLAITQTVNAYIDPISKRPITNPVRNTICKHVYDKESADMIINNKKNKGCPNFGCTNKQTMRAEHIELDLNLQHTIQATQRVSQESQEY